MRMTQKLYYDDSGLYQREFDAAVQRQTMQNGKAHVVLDRTLFYPGGGGQPCDLGTLDGSPVEAVYEHEGEIVHVLGGPLPRDAVHGEIDWPRRFELMQQHLGQHILSAVFLRDYGLGTVGLRIERDTLSIDLDGYVNEEKVALAEASANETIYENVPVEVLFPDLEEIRHNSKRAIPQTEGPIRIVKIGHLDYTPCCGLHNRSTGEVGIIKVRYSDKHKSGSRIHFLCGRPALRWVCRICSDTMSLMREMNCSGTELLERIKRQQSEVQELKEQRQGLLCRLSGYEAPELLRNASRIGDVAIVKHILPNTTQEEMKQLFTLLTEKKRTLVLLGGKTASGACLMFGCHKTEKGVDVRAAFKEAISMIGGKGGGGPCYAQGSGPDIERLAEAVEVADRIVVRQLDR